MEARLIALYSPAPQSGKSTVASIIVDEYGYTRVGFADPLRGMARQFLMLAGYPLEMVEFLVTTGEGKATPLPELGGCTPRHLMQTLGTEWGRKLVASNVWVDLALKGTEKSFTVIDDMRFPNEYVAIREAGGEVWRIENPRVTFQSDHPSEGLLETHEFDEIIVNDGSLEDLAKKTQWALTGAY